jgi:Tripartite tricarboxylate transporter TctB family
VSTVVRNPKDFWAGAIYVGVGVAAVWIGRNYAFGSGARMGPGYFPTVLGVILALFGAASLVRSLLHPGEPVGAIAWKPLAMITGATVLFGYLLPRAGLIVALLVLVLVSAAASEKFRFDWRATVGLIALIAACTVVFVMALGVPMPVLGTWFGE